MLQPRDRVKPDNANCQADEEVRCVSPRELAIRWQCSRSSVDRIARRAGFTRLCLGEGRNGLVRYLRQDVEKYETARKISMN
jgi:hypothetical protein